MRIGSTGLVVPRGVDPEDLDAIVLQPQKKIVVFVCPVCQNRHRTDIAGLEPMCTGPNLVLDEHPMELMIRVYE